jgi:hypothetical protein
VKVFNEIFGAIEKLRPYHQKNTLLVDLLKAEIENVYDRLIVENVGTTLNLSGGYLIAAAFSKIMQNTPNVKKDLTVIADQLKNVGVIMFDNGKIEFDLENAVSSAVSCCGFTLRRK